MAIEERTNKNGEICSYRFRVCVGRDEQYKQVWRTKTIKRPEGLTPARERKEVERLHDEWERTQKAEWEQSHDKIDRTKITFADFTKNHWWKDSVLDGTHTPSTIDFFEYTSKPALEFFGSEKLTAITGEKIKRFLNHLRNEAKTQSGQPLSSATVKHDYATLRNILGYARRMRYITENPCENLSVKEKPHREKKKIDFLTPEEARVFIACLEGEPLYWKAFVLLLLTTGLRRGEACGLQWNDIDGEKLQIRVSRNVTVAGGRINIGKTKTGEERTVPITSRLNAILTALRTERETALQCNLLPNSFVFCSPSDPFEAINPNSATRWLRRFENRHDLRTVSPHDLRHSSATLAIENGATLKEVQQLLGHADPQTTLQFYTGVSEEQQRKTAAAVDETLFGN